MYKQSKESLEKLTPQQALELLMEGNIRFVENKMLKRDPIAQIRHTSSGQYPFAAILSCIDSRVPVEVIFDQYIGDVFSARVAGNVVNEDVLGSLEYACKVVGSKLIVVLGHTKCGAVTAACNQVELGNITTLLDKIQPAVKRAGINTDNLSQDDIETVSIFNVKESIRRIKEDSPILAELEENGTIMIVGASYDVTTGEVTFL